MLIFAIALEKLHNLSRMMDFCNYHWLCVQHAISMSIANRNKNQVNTYFQLLNRPRVDDPGCSSKFPFSACTMSIHQATIKVQLLQDVRASVWTEESAEYMMTSMRFPWRVGDPKIYMSIKTAPCPRPSPAQRCWGANTKRDNNWIVDNSLTKGQYIKIKFVN